MIKYMSEKGKKEIDIVDGELLGNILRFVWPLMLANILQITFHFADTIVIGNYVSEKGLAAVGTTGPITIFFTWGLYGLSMGANVLISRMIGARRTQQIRNAVFSAMLIGLLSGVAVTLIGVVFARLFLEWLGTPADIMHDALLYLRLYFICGIPIGLFDFGSSILRAGGDTKRPTLYLAISGLLNVVLNLIFVVVFRLSVAGVAIATIISQSAAAFAVTTRLLKQDGLISLDPDFSLADKQLIITILKYGIPSALQNQMFSFSNMIVQSSINSFGSVFVAANTAANAIEEYVYVFVDAFPQASLTFTSQLYGARKFEKIRKMLIEALLLCGIGSFLIGLVILLNGTTFLGMISSDPEVIAMGMIRLRYVTFFLFLNGLLDVVVNSIRGMGLSNLPTLVTLFGVCGFRILYVYTYFAANPLPKILYLCFPLSWLLTFVIQSIIWIIVYFRKKDLEEQ